MVELEVDPDDPERLLLASEETLFRSEDGGDHWRPIVRAAGHAARVAGGRDGSTAPTARAQITVSADAGDHFEPAGRVEGEPARLKAVDGRHLYIALEDGSILESRDGAKSWKPVYTP